MDNEGENDSMPGESSEGEMDMMPIKKKKPKNMAAAMAEAMNAAAAKKKAPKVLATSDPNNVNSYGP